MKLFNDRLSARARLSLSGFTLIELLVVIGLIGVLAAGIGVAMRGGNPTSALRAGQSSIVGALSAARGQSALAQADSMIVVDVTNSGDEQYLRALRIVVNVGTDQWRAVGDPIVLPQGIYVVPPSSPSVGGSITLESGWGAARRSKGFQNSITGLNERPYESTTYPYYETNTFSGRTYLKFQTFKAIGTTSGAGSILVTPGRRTSATAITLDNPDNIRGVYVSRYGVATLIDEASSFDNLTVP